MTLNYTTLCDGFKWLESREDDEGKRQAVAVHFWICMCVCVRVRVCQRVLSLQVSLKKHIHQVNRCVWLCVFSIYL